MRDTHVETGAPPSAYVNLVAKCWRRDTSDGVREVTGDELYRIKVEGWRSKWTCTTPVIIGTTTPIEPYQPYKPPQIIQRDRDTSALMRAMYCDLGEPADSADAPWCERYQQYLRTHPQASRESAITAASGGHVDSATAAELREETSWWRSYCARTYGRPGEYEPFQRQCRKRGLVR